SRAPFRFNRNGALAIGCAARLRKHMADTGARFTLQPIPDSHHHGILATNARMQKIPASSPHQWRKGQWGNEPAEVELRCHQTGIDERKPETVHGGMSGQYAVG